MLDAATHNNNHSNLGGLSSGYKILSQKCNKYLFLGYFKNSAK